MIRSSLYTLFVASTLCLIPQTLTGATVSGVVFEDADQDGLLDAGESPLESVSIRLFGRADGGGVEDRTVVTGPAGTYFFDVPDGAYVVEVAPPAGYRLGPVRTDCPGAGREPYPVLQRRISSTGSLTEDLAADNLLHYALGDSIAAGLSFCIFDDTEYHDDVHIDRVTRVAPGATLVNAAEAGHTTAHLLRDAGVAPDGNTVLDAVANDPGLVSISIGGNDFLDVDPGPGLEPPTQADADLLALCGARALNSMRANIQEALAYLTYRLPQSDVELNTVYDNLGQACGPDTTEFHNRWVPVGNNLIRTLAWGQTRRVTVAEVWPDYAHMNVQGTECCGEMGLICLADQIHPNAEGRRVHENRFWDSLGGVLLGSRDDVGSTVRTVDFGMVRLVDTRRPTLVRDETLDGATAGNAVLDGSNDSGASVPVSGGSFFVEGLDAAPRGIRIDRALVGVRYRGTGTYEDDLYWFEASFDPSFPAHGQTLDTWDTVMPIVGGSQQSWTINTTGSWTCNELARPDGARILLDPEAQDWREVTTMLTKNLVDLDPSTGVYSWPKVGFGDLSRLSVRIRSQVVGTPDAFRLEWDDVWVDIYGGLAPGPQIVAEKEVLDPISGTPLTEATAGQDLRYRIRFSNTGSGLATSVGFQDTVPACLEFIDGPFLDGAPAGSFAAGVVTVPIGDLPDDGVTHEVHFDVRVGAGCSGDIPNQGVFTFQENPAGSVTDDPATGDPRDPTVFRVAGGGVLTGTDPLALQPGDPFGCAVPRLDPASDGCAACQPQDPNSWVVPSGLVPEGVTIRFYEVQARGCTAAGDPERLCLGRVNGADLSLQLVAGPCP